MRKIKEWVIIFLVLPIADKVFHTKINYWYRKIRKMRTWSSNEVTQWQTEKLQKLIKHAYLNTVYYKDLFDNLNINPDDIKNIEDLKRIPPLTKDIIRANFKKLIPNNIDSFYYNTASTGGSTGDPLKFYRDTNSWSFDNAFQIIAWQQTGYKYGDKFIALGSSSIFPTNKKSIIHDLYYKLKGKIPLNAMNMTNEIMRHYVNFIAENKIHYVYGYASSIYLLAKYIDQNKLNEKVNIKACFSTSEVLTEKYRDCIERSFNCTVLDCYGAGDGGVVANKNSIYGYTVGYNSICQVLNGEDSGPLLLTDLTNFAFPLIRYQIGDAVELQTKENSVYNGQVLKKVLGRTSDIIQLENGRILTGPGFTILFKDLNVKSYKIYKSNILTITVEIVKDTKYSMQEEKLIISTMHKYAGNDCNIIVTYVEFMHQNINGKRGYFVN